MRSLIQTWERENQQSLETNIKNNLSGSGGSTNIGDGSDLNQHFTDPSAGPDFPSDLDVKLEPLDGASSLDCFPASMTQRDLDQFISDPTFLPDIDFNQFPPMDVDQEESKQQSSFRDASLQEDPPDIKNSPTKTEELLSILADDNGKGEDEKPPPDTGQTVIETSSDDSVEKSSSTVSGEFDATNEDVEQSNQSLFEIDDDGPDLHDLNDVKEFIKKTSKDVALVSMKDEDIKDITPDKIHQSPSVSITAVDLSSIPSPQLLPQVTVDRRPNIEVIPIPNVPSSITITPISAKTIAEEKSKKSKKDINGKIEKKRKRKLETESSIVPEKIKKHSGSLKMSDSSRSSSPSDYASNQLPSSTMVMKLGTAQKLKQSTSPTLSISSVSLPSSNKYTVTSPKSNSGKPSLSALKMAVHSPKNESKQKIKEFSKDKEKRSYSSSNSSLSQSPKSSKSSSKKSDVEDIATPIPPDSSKAQIKCRKLSAVIDRLSKDKTAQHYSVDSEVPKNKESTVKTSDKSIILNSNINLKNPESYQVKHSSDGMKITINKTRTKESKQKSSLASSPKPGPKSGSSSGLNSKKTAYPIPKAGPSSSQSKPFSVPKKSNLTVTKVKSGSNKIRSDKSIFARTEMRKSSPTSKDEEPLKLVNPVESIIKHKLDTSKFQIPKLSARANADDKRCAESKTDLSKPMDLAKKIDVDKKYSQNDYLCQKKSTTERLNSLPGITVTTVEERLKPKESALSSLKIDLPLISFHTPKADTTVEVSECKDYSQKKEELSNNSVYQQKPVTPVTTYATTPSVSVHILKSPVPSPLLVPSPHSASPSITDEELIDDAFVRVGK